MSQGVKEAEVERILIMMNGGNEYQINERVFANNIQYSSSQCKDLQRNQIFLNPRDALIQFFCIFSLKKQSLEQLEICGAV